MASVETDEKEKSANYVHSTAQCLNGSICEEKPIFMIELQLYFPCRAIKKMVCLDHVDNMEFRTPFESRPNDMRCKSKNCQKSH
jgi:hypothetical protein